MYFSFGEVVDPYLTDDSSEDSGNEESEQSEGSGSSPLPYPYVGRPYVTNSLLNTIDLKLLRQCAADIARVKVRCIQLQCSKYRLSHILFETEALSFSNASSS